MLESKGGPGSVDVGSDDCFQIGHLVIGEGNLLANLPASQKLLQVLECPSVHTRVVGQLAVKTRPGERQICIDRMTDQGQEQSKDKVQCHGITDH